MGGRGRQGKADKGRTSEGEGRTEKPQSQGRSSGETEPIYADRRPSAVMARRHEPGRGGTEPGCVDRRAIWESRLEWRSLEQKERRGGEAKPTSFGFRSDAEGGEARSVGNPAGGGHQLRWRPTSSISGRARRRQGQGSDLAARAPLHALVRRRIADAVG